MILQKNAVDSLVFGLKDDVNFSNSDTVKNFVESYYVIKKEENRIPGGFSDFDITKQELDEHLKKYFNIEGVNYTDILKETCPNYDEYTKTFNSELSVFLKYDTIKEEYESLEDKECFANPPVDYDYNPKYTKI